MKEFGEGIGEWRIGEWAMRRGSATWRGAALARKQTTPRYLLRRVYDRKSP
jgi:hypothetical protein